MVLGSGLSGAAGFVKPSADIPYSRIPGWPLSAVPGHPGRLVFGSAGGRRAVILCGRVHLYEGFSPEEVVFGVRAAGKLGARVLVITNAAGAVNPSLVPGSLVLISDHFNLQGASPLAGPQAESFGPRFLDMTEAYSLRLRRIAHQAAARCGFELSEGVYAAVLGPSYETPAEVRFLRSIGADLVGMSTVQEVIAARQMGIEVLGISCVTNLAAGLSPAPLTHDEVLRAGRRAEHGLRSVIAEFAALLEPAGL